MTDLTDTSELLERSRLRALGLERRNALTENLRDAYSQIIRKKVIEYIDSISAKFVHVYLGFRTEVGTSGIIEDLFDRNIKIIVPLTRGERGNEHMIHSLLEKNCELVPGKFGVPEPVKVKEISVDSLDAIIIPIVAFDGMGMRLGYGKGYYDQFLSGLKGQTTKIGLAFSVQEMDKIPKMSHDQLMNSVFTEQSSFFFK